MAHERPRHIAKVIQQRAKLWPVIGVMGPRQSGKSTLLRNQLRHGAYVTLDSPTARGVAERSPELFVRDALAEDKRLTIDEVQKVPDLFDTIKLIVDEDRRPGMFFISGSTQFSSRVGIRESLTGRIGLHRLFPLTAAECHGFDFHKPLVDLVMGRTPRHSGLSVVEILKSARLGGMPGHCFLRNQNERREYLRGWLETTCFRDSTQIRSTKAIPSLLEAIYLHVARNPFQDASNIGAAIGENPRRISNQLGILEELFVVGQIAPSPLGAGKARFFPTDSGFAATAGCADLDVVRLWLVNEILAQFAYAGEDQPRLQFFKSKNGSVIDYLFPAHRLALLVNDEEVVHEYSLRAAKSFAQRHKSWRVIIASPATIPMSLTERLRIEPWARLC